MSKSKNRGEISQYELDHLNLDEIAQRNGYRRDIKSKATPGPWYVKTNTYRGAGTKYEVRKHVEPRFLGDKPEEKAIVGEGLDKDDKAFIAFARNDEPERDIDLLIAKIKQLRTFEVERKKMVEYIALLEDKVRQLKNQVTDLENTNAQVNREYKGYIRQTDYLYQNTDILRQGLEFYASDANWDWQMVHHPILKDNGRTAKTALEITKTAAELAEGREEVPEPPAEPISIQGRALEIAEMAQKFMKKARR